MRRRAFSVVIGLSLSVALPLAAYAAPTRAQWAAGADAVCARELSAMHVLERRAAAQVPLSLRQWVAMYDQLVAAFGRMRQDIAALPRPAADRTTIQSLVSYLGSAIGEMKAVRKATLTRDARALRLHVDRSEQLVRRAEAVALRLGARSCANG